MPFGSPGVYPFPVAGGPPYLKFRQLQAAFAEVTDKHIYEDGGLSVVTFNDSAPIRFVVEYNGLTAAQFQTIADHYADAGFEAYGFTLTNPRTSTAYTDCHYETWEEDHTKTWSVSLRVVIVKRPA